MKRMILTFIVSLSFIALTACSFEFIESDGNNNSNDIQTNENAGQSESEAEANDESNTEGEDGGVEFVLDVYKKAIDAAEDIRSAEMTVDMDQILEFEEESMEISSNFIIQMVAEPFIMHQKGTTAIPFGIDDADSMDIEMYITDEDMYMYEAFTGSWMHMSGGNIADLADFDDQQDPYEQLKMFENHIENFSVEVTNDSYVLSLTADADSFDEALQEMIDGTISSDLDALLDDDASIDPFAGADIERLSYQMTIDKSSLQIREYDMQMDMTIMDEDEPMRISQNMHTVYSKINEIDSIEIPQEIIDGAESFF